MSIFRKTLFPTLIIRLLLYGFMLLFTVFIAGVMSYFFLQLSPLLLVLVVFYFYIIWAILADAVKLTFFLLKIFVAEKKQKERVLKLLESEIYDYKELLKTEKSEMDTHRLDTRNEPFAINYSKRGEKEIKIRLKLLTKLHGLLIDAMTKEPSSIYDIDLDSY